MIEPLSFIVGMLVGALIVTVCVLAAEFGWLDRGLDAIEALVEGVVGLFKRNLTVIEHSDEAENTPSERPLDEWPVDEDGSIYGLGWPTNEDGHYELPWTCLKCGWETTWPPGVSRHVQAHLDKED